MIVWSTENEILLSLAKVWTVQTMDQLGDAAKAAVAAAEVAEVMSRCM